MPEKKFNVEHITSLARLKIKDADRARLVEDLTQILKYIQQLNKLDTSGVEPTSHVLPLENVFREDIENRQFGDADRFLEEASKHYKDHYEVPKIIG